MASEKVVRITMEGGIPVGKPDPVEVKKNEDKLRWCADFDFKITIDGYTDVKYSHGSNGCAFEAKTGNFDQERQYKYTITANGVDNDPTIDVKP